MIEKRTWEEFRKNGLLFAINQFLHFFGWAIVVVIDDETNLITDAYPARVKFRGFDEKATDEGYKQVGTYLKESAEEISKDLDE